eukprot:13778530-Alexandrium_andersonii.AAC.1
MSCQADACARTILARRASSALGNGPVVREELLLRQQVLASDRCQGPRTRQMDRATPSARQSVVEGREAADAARRLRQRAGDTRGRPRGGARGG